MKKFKEENVYIKYKYIFILFFVLIVSAFAYFLNSNKPTQEIIHFENDLIIEEIYGCDFLSLRIDPEDSPTFIHSDECSNKDCKFK